jgi:hypothetical protein
MVEFARFIGTTLPAVAVPSINESGEVYGEKLCGLATARYAAQVQADRKRNPKEEPVAVMNLPLLFEHFERVGRSLKDHRDPAAARLGFGKDATEVAEDLLEDAVEELGSDANLTAGVMENLRETVFAFVFPDVEEYRRSEAWMADKRELFDAIRTSMRERRGWGDE